ncbi:MAG TPA: hypothetical protein ENK30_01570 [Anaerolineae bacterium]|nr:hypothetical protein [Anaerolineae bacterium]
MPLDLLALALIILTAGIALLLRLRAHESAVLGEDEARFYRQNRTDPTAMRLPLTGLDAAGSVAGEGAYLPVELEMLLEAKAGAEEDTPEAAGLGLALSPGPKQPADSLSLRVQETLAALSILLGLTFLLFWLISIF